MPRTFLQKEKKEMFVKLTKQYRHEGYSLKESEYYAQRDADDAMSDKELFIDNYMKDMGGEDYE